jgi:hypothetical protein
MRTYYYAVIGAIGGLLAWRVSDLLGLSFAANLTVSELVVGGLIGLCIGLLIGATEGIVSRSPQRALRSAIVAGPWAGGHRAACEAAFQRWAGAAGRVRLGRLRLLIGLVEAPPANADGKGLRAAKGAGELVAAAPLGYADPVTERRPGWFCWGNGRRLHRPDHGAAIARLARSHLGETQGFRVHAGQVHPRRWTIGHHRQ